MADTHRSVWYNVGDCGLLSSCNHGDMATLSLSSGPDQFTIEFLPKHRPRLKTLLGHLDKIAGDKLSCPDEPPSEPPAGHVFVRRWVLVPERD